MARVRLAPSWLAALGLLLCVAQEGAAQSPMVRPRAGKDDSSAETRLGAGRPQARSQGPEIFFCETPDTSCRTTQDTFSLNGLRDLYVFVAWPGVSGQHVQTVQFLLPDGSAYSTKKTKFTVGSASPDTSLAPAIRKEVSPPPPAEHLIADANKTHAQGIPALLMSSRGDPAVLTVLPIGGTYVTQRNLSGTWQVRVLLDEQLVLESALTLTPLQPAAKEVQGVEP